MAKKLAIVSMGKSGECDELDLAISRAAKKGFSEVIVMEGDTMAVGAVVLMSAMIDEPLSLTIYHPAQDVPISSDSVGLEGNGIRWYYVLENLDKIAAYVKGTKPETKRSFTLETLVSDADAVVAVNDGSNSEVKYAFKLALELGKPVYWIPPPGSNSLPEEWGKARWIMPKGGGDG